MAQKFKLKFLGHIYELMGDEPDIDLQEVATYVEKKAADIENRYPGLSPSRQMVLIAMSLGKEYFYLKKSLDRFSSSLDSKLKTLNEKLDTQLMKKKD